MFSLHKLLHKEDKLLSLLEASAAQARASVLALAISGKNPGAPAGPRDIGYSRQKDRDLTQLIRQEIYGSFIASLDREDVIGLANTLYKIPKTASKFDERLRTSPEFVRAIDFSAQLALLDEATDVVVQLVGSLAKINLDKMKVLNDRLHAIEGEADRQMLGLYKEIFSGKYQAVQVIVLKDLYELLEKLIDRCRDAGNIVTHIALKNS